MIINQGVPVLLEEDGGESGIIALRSSPTRAGRCCLDAPVMVVNVPVVQAITTQVAQ